MEKINKWVSNLQNIYSGDITISFDGNIEILDNNLNDFNGYLYKVISFKYFN